MDAIHLAFLDRPPILRLDDLFNVMERMLPKDRDQAFFFTYMQFVSQEIADDARETDRIGDSLKEHTSYSKFRTAISSLPENMSEMFLVQSVVFHALTGLWGRANMDKDKVIGSNKRAMERAQALLEAGDLTSDQKEACESGIKFTQEKIRNIDQDIAEAKQLYRYFCWDVVRPLMHASA